MTEPSEINKFIIAIGKEIESNLAAHNFSANNVSVSNPNENEGTVLGWKYIETLEKGRGPTSAGAPKGNPTLREAIEDWIARRSITVEGITSKSLAYIISKKIHEQGNKLYRAVRGGQQPNNIFSGVITDERIDAFTSSYADVQILYLQSQIVQAFKQEAR